MKKNIIKKITGFFILSILIIACSEDTENRNIPDPEGQTTIEIDTKALLEENLECDMYVFQKAPADATYKLDKIVNFGNQNQKNVDFPNIDLNTLSYRLLFIAVPAVNKNEIAIKSTTGTSLQAGDLWTNVRLEATTQELSDMFYYGITDKTGMQIFTEGEIKGNLTRLVGQQIIDIFKTDKGDLTKPLHKLDSIGSVLDRVYKIDIEYQNLTKVMAFEGNKLVQKEQFTAPYTQIFEPKINETAGSSFLKVTLPQTDKNGKELFTAIKADKSPIKGSLKIKGPFGLPAKEKIRIKATFHYYHTTPSECKNANPGSHAHTKECFETKTLLLNLPPDKAGQTLLTTKSDTITLNQAGIRYDRIIDIKAEGSFGFDTKWD